MEKPTTPHASFMVRIWQEAGQPPGKLRGSVENIRTGQRLYFSSLADMNDFICFQLIADTNTAQNQPQGEENPK